MISKAKVAPPYSMLFVSDKEPPDAPDPAGRAVAWNDDCVVLRCRYEHDGETTVLLGPASEAAVSRTPVFDKDIATPSREVVVSTAELAVVLRAQVRAPRTRVRIWSNDPSEPDEIIIGLE